MRYAVIAMAVAVLMIVPMIAEASSADSVRISVEPVSDRTYRFSAPLSGTWDTGDGGIYTGSTVTHTFSVSGLHRVTFVSGDVHLSATALVTDRSPVTSATTGSVYNYCPGFASSVTTDCPGLFWNPSTLSLTGIPAAAGDYTVTVDGGSFGLRVSVGVAQIDRSFDIETDGLTVHVRAASAGVPGINYWWQVLKTDGSVVAEGVSAEQTFVLQESGDYIMKCTMKDASLQTSSFSRQFTVTEPEVPEENESDGFHIPVWAWVVAGVAGLLIIGRRFI